MKHPLTGKQCDDYLDWLVEEDSFQRMAPNDSELGLDTQCPICGKTELDQPGLCECDVRRGNV